MSGELPADGEISVGGVRLPAGRRRYGKDRRRGALLWATDNAVAEPGPLWQAADGPARELGLSVVILDDLHGGGGRPWDSNELGLVGFGQLSGGDPWEVFRDRWTVQVPVGSLPPEERPRRTLPDHFPPFEIVEEDPEETAWFLDKVAPWGIQFPGLALAEREPLSPGRIHDALRAMAPGRIGLVPVERSADVPTAVGWIGALNHFMGSPEDQRDGPAQMSVMMRSWEDRFGARLLRIGFDTMTFLVSRPPRTEASALAVAAEHFAFAGTDGFQPYARESRVNSIRTLARAIQDSPRWMFWWD